MTEGFRFGVLGPVVMWRGTTEVRFGSAKHQRLLAALLLHVNERVERQKIIDTVWEGEPPRSAVNLVQKYVGDLRRAFGATGPQLRSIGTGYRLDLPPHDLDSAVFGGLINQADAGQQAEQRLRDALALWRGPAYDGIDAEPIRTERARLTELRHTAREDLVEAVLDRGDHDTAAAELAMLTSAEPLRERLRELQMLALYRQGRRADALAVFTSIRAQLADELGIDPGPGLRRRYEQILRDDPALEPGNGVKPEPALPVRQLPLDVADFVGRAEPLDEVGRLLTASSGSGPKVVVVVGGPGVGKSSLVLRAAHHVSDAFPDGQLYFDLAATSERSQEPAQLLAEALRALSVIGRAIPDGLPERAALYRSLLADRRMLVVLDDAGHADQIRPLLPAAGGCAVLVTSRARHTHLPGARHIDLDVLGPAEAWELFTGIVGADRVAAEPAEARAILDCCGNLPLAIRIAGAKLAGRPGWSLRVLRERLEDESRRPAELRIGDLGVRASVELSLRLLPAEAVRAFALLGLLGAHTVPGWVLGPLLGRPDADDVLDTLVDASLVRLISTDAIGQPRYRLHDLIRTCAVDVAARIPVAEQREAIGRVLGAWLDLVERASDRLPAGLLRPKPGTAPRWPLPDDVAARLVADAFGWFDAERENLVGAISLAANWQLAETAWELAVGAVTYQDHRCLYQDWQHGHRIALDAVRAAGNFRGEAALLRGLAQLHIYRDEFDEATAALEASDELCERVQDRLGKAQSVSMLGTVNHMLGNYGEAVTYIELALAIASAEEDRHLEAQLCGAMATMRLAQGDLNQAAVWFDTALRRAEALDDPHRLAVMRRRVNRLHDRLGNPRAALKSLRQALDTFEELEDERCAAYTLMEIGRVHAGQHEQQPARTALERAAAVFHRHGDRQDEAQCWQLLGDLDAAVGTSDSARDYLARALRLWRAIGDVQATGRVIVTLRRLTIGVVAQPT
ncbi:AfsR/SARP family transcriptional regulator [Kutzneria chonburiensis]|uniref:BTAD domain-containing putative transcriptional regulator n=1 Tax=Kutzneria chonburiensis TaxID=1483604 RepID=A0ABV6MMM1_9PSEU|nr:BTAD domain-containing putative transcriptional regulator [Kutzneria chonburiensis]